MKLHCVRRAAALGDAVLPVKTCVNADQDLELIADEEVSTLRSEMIVAADEDEEANRLRQPAASKLRLLPTVVSTLQKCVPCLPEPISSKLFSTTICSRV